MKAGTMSHTQIWHKKEIQKSVQDGRSLEMIYLI